MFGNSLENLGNRTGEYKNQHSNKFSKFLKIFENLRKSSEKLRNCRKVLKTTFEFFVKSSEIVGNLRKSSEKIGKCRKVLKTIFRQFLKIFENFRKSSKCSEMLGKLLKASENLRMYLGGYETFYNIPISDTYGLKIRFKNLDL